jgi:hypothetical protein
MYGENKAGKVMGEYKRGELKTKAGKKVKKRKQAVAIAMSEGGMSGAIEEGVKRGSRY